MVLDVGEAEPCRNSDRPAERDIERRLADAIAMTFGEHARGAIGLGIGVIDVGVVADFVAHGTIEDARLLDAVRGRTGGLPGLGLDALVIAVDEFGRAQVEPKAGIGLILGAGFNHGA